MPINYYLGKTEQELLEELRIAQARQARGSVAEVTAAGVRTRKEFGRDQDVAEIIKRIRWSLYLLAVQAQDAAKLTAYPNPYAEQVRTTAARYS